nr:hypothetical protein [Tanacetum cinerariifolium]
MTGNISYLSEYEPYDGGYVSFRQGGGKITGKDFKLKYDTNVLLRTPRQPNMYSIDLNNIVPHKNMTCLVAKASVDESMLWHRRLGHLNFKTMNKLVRNNLVKGLPSKCFKNDHTCVACLKEKQHKASCKTKLVKFVSKPLHTLHMDLFGPTYVSSLNHKWYCLVVNDDFSRFTWTFFLRTKDETSGILRNFIIEIENLKDLKVKIIRYDNGGEFKNKEMNEFCTKKGIKREFSNARTPQQNEVAERRNITLIEAARTMLADAKLPTTWGSLMLKVVKVILLGTLCLVHHIGYLIRTKKVQENLHVDFLENKLIEKGAGPNWLFDIDTLTNFINYVPVVVAGTSSTNILGTKDVASQAVKKDVSSLRYIALPNWFHEAYMESSNSDAQDACNADVPESSGISNPTATSKIPPADQMESLTMESEIPTVSSPVPTVCLDISPETLSGSRLISKGVISQEETPSLGNALTLSNRFEDTIGVEVDLRNMKSSIPASPTPTFRIHKDYPESQIIGPVVTPVQTRHKKNPKKIFDALKDPSWVEAMQEDFFNSRFRMFGFWLAVLKGVFEALMHDKFQMSAMGELTFFLGLQVLQKKYGIFLLQDKYIGDIFKKFGYSDVRSSNTPMDKENPWGKDGPGKDVELHLYRSMIGSLMYLTASRPDIMFAICAYARHQVTPKECHLHAVKRIFRYLKGHSKLGLWYPKESPFDLVAYSDSDYGGATQDRKSTNGEYVAAASGCGQVLWIQNQMPDYGNSIIAKLAFCDYHNMIAILEKTEHNIDFHQIVDFLEASHIRIETTNQGTKIIATVDGKLRTISESSLMRHLKLNDTEGISSLPDTLLFENLSLIRAIRIAQSKALSPAADEPASLLRDDRQGEAFDTVSSLDAAQDRENIIKNSALPHESSPRVTSLDADDGRLSFLKTKIEEVQSLFKRMLQSKGGSMKIGEEVGVERSTELGSNDTEEMVNVLSSMEAANILTSGVAAVSVSPVAGVSTAGVPTVSGLFPTVIFTTASVVTPYSRRPIGISAKDKGKEKVVESEVPKKRKFQEQIDTQVAREKEEEFARENKRLSEQLVRDYEIARLHAEEELKMMIEGLDGSNEVIAKHLQKYEQAAANLSVGEKIELINELEQREFYMYVLRSHAGWKTKHLRGMALEEIKEKFIPVWKQLEDFVPMSSKEEGERIKKKGLKLDQGSAKRMKTYEDVSEEDLKASTFGRSREYWKIIRLGGHTSVYQFFVDMLKQFDREDLHQLWTLVKETLSISQATKDKEKELWVELKRLFEPNFEDQLWTHNQAFMHDPLEWKLYDTCGVHHVFTKDQEIFMLVEKDYPLRKGLATVMICNKLQVEQYSQMANDLILKIHNIANSLR